MIDQECWFERLHVLTGGEIYETQCPDVTDNICNFFSAYQRTVRNLRIRSPIMQPLRMKPTNRQCLQKFSLNPAEVTACLDGNKSSPFSGIDSIV